MSDKRRKSEYLLSEIGGIDESFLAEADSYRKRKSPVWLKPLVAAACACILVVGALGAIMGGKLMTKGEAAMDRIPENNMSVKDNFEESADASANSVAGLVGDMIIEGRLYFHGSRNSALIVRSDGGILWLHADSEDFFKDLDSGDYVKVGHGPVMTSYPGQTHAESIALIKDGDIYSFTDEEWESLKWILPELPER